MNQTTYIIGAIFILFAITMITRIFPFIFGNLLKNSTAVQTLGEYLPASIMVLLVLYEINIKSITTAPYGIPACLGLIIVTLVHLWKRNIIFSITAGTVSYMLFIHIL